MALFSQSIIDKNRALMQARPFDVVLFVGRYISGTYWTVLAHLTREFHPLRFSQVVPFACDGSRPFKAVSTLGLRLDNRISPICGSSPPSQPRLVCARKAAPPIPPLSSWDHGLLNPARLSFRAHIGCIQ